MYCKLVGLVGASCAVLIGIPSLLSCWFLIKQKKKKSKLLLGLKQKHQQIVKQTIKRSKQVDVGVNAPHIEPETIKTVEQLQKQLTLPLDFIMEMMHNAE